MTLFVGSNAFARPAKRVYAGVYLHDVTKFDQKDGVFDVDLELWAKWLGDFDASRLSIGNASSIERELLGEEQDGEWHAARWRVKGTLRGEFPLQRFPFDEQTLSVVLELPERDGQLVPDLAGSGMRERFSVTGWLYEPYFVPRIDSEIYRSDLGAIEGEGRPTTVGRAAFEVTLRRPLLTAATKLFLPLLVILLVALVALFVHPKELEVRASVGVTALLACFAFHFAVADTMPNVAYITLADVLFLVAYALTAVLLIVSVAAKTLHTKGREAQHEKLDRYALIAFPILLVGSVLIALPSPPDAHADEDVAVEELRPASARKQLVIGVSSLARPTGGLASRGAHWGTTRTLPDGSSFPVLVREVPAITNDSLRFLANGHLEVTWRLRPNLRWSDGAPLTARDLEFALAVSPDPRVDEVRVVGPQELLVRYKERVAVALESITPLPHHALKEVYEKGGYDAVREHRSDVPIPSAGPYRVAEFKAEELLVLEANEHYAGRQPSIARIEMRRYPDDAALVAAFAGGAIDMIALNAIEPETAVALGRRHPGAVHIRPSETLLYLHPDLEQPLLARLDVRRALLMGIDRERLQAAVFGETAKSAPVAHIPVPGALPGGTVQIGYDAEAARLALETAGAAGASLPLVHGPAPIDKEIASHVVRDAAAAGITLEPKAVKNTRDVMRKGGHGGLVLQTSTGERDDPPEKYWNLPRPAGTYDRGHRHDAFDDAMAALVGREERALYPERREQIRDMLFANYSKRLPMLPLLFLADRIVVDPALRGWEIGSGKNFGTTIERWYFETDGGE